MPKRKNLPSRCPLLSIKHLRRAEIQETITSITGKISGYDLINGKILKELPITGIK
jgi:hypothetical protein